MKTKKRILRNNKRKTVKKKQRNFKKRSFRKRSFRKRNFRKRSSRKRSSRKRSSRKDIKGGGVEERRNPQEERHNPQVEGRNATLKEIEAAKQAEEKAAKEAEDKAAKEAKEKAAKEAEEKAAEKAANKAKKAVARNKARLLEDTMDFPGTFKLHIRNVEHGRDNESRLYQDNEEGNKGKLVEPMGDHSYIYKVTEVEKPGKIPISFEVGKCYTNISGKGWDLYTLRRDDAFMTIHSWREKGNSLRVEEPEEEEKKKKRKDINDKNAETIYKMTNFFYEYQPLDDFGSTTINKHIDFPEKNYIDGYPSYEVAKEGKIVKMITFSKWEGDNWSNTQYVMRLYDKTNLDHREDGSVEWDKSETNEYVPIEMDVCPPNDGWEDKRTEQINEFKVRKVREAAVQKCCDECSENKDDAKASALDKAKSPSNSIWDEVTTEDGTVYYHNKETGKTSWYPKDE
jgi:hypothetical protein